MNTKGIAQKLAQSRKRWHVRGSDDLKLSIRVDHTGESCKSSCEPTPFNMEQM